MTTNYIGKPQSRVDGKLKVTGGAKYAAEHSVPNLAYGYVVSSEIAKGKIVAINAAEALNFPGVIKVLTHENRPDTAWRNSKYKDDIAPAGAPFRALYDENIAFSGQPIALVVAEDFETARYAASLIEVEYQRDAFVTDLDVVREEAYDAPKGKTGYQPPPPPRGNPEEAWENAEVKIEFNYDAPDEHHNPMEMHASTVVYNEDGKLTIYDKTQGVLNSQQYVTNIFGLSTDDVRVLTPFMGGGFGSGLRPQYQLFLATLAALDLKRSVKVVLTRQQMFTFGHRPNTKQRVSLGAHSNGTLESVIHEALSETSQFEDFTENVVNWSGALYQCSNVKLAHQIAKLDLYTPLDMRAPGAAWGLFALESAVDELAAELKMDPLEFRKKNYAYDDQNEGKPYSSKELMKCYDEGAAAFGWNARQPEPRSMREGRELIGYGMATGIWDATQSASSAKAAFSADGKLSVASASCDIGTGTYTICTQIAADIFGVPIDDVEFTLGDTTLPQAPIQGGSWTASSVGSAVKDVCEKLHEQIYKLAQKAENSPFASATLEEVSFDGGKIALKSDASSAIAFTDVIKNAGEASVEAETSLKPDYLEQRKYSMHTHSACFVEVRVDEELGRVRVTRATSAIAGGKILNPKTARSQILGAVVWGIGMALEEESVLDHNFGRFINHTLAEYHVAVNADVPEIEVIFVEERDDVVNPLGIKGLGEIGIIGVAAAIANAIYHATGKRVRDLPITIDKLL